MKEYNLLGHVSDFKHRLHKACDLAHKKLTEIKSNKLKWKPGVTRKPGTARMMPDIPGPNTIDIKSVM